MTRVWLPGSPEAFGGLPANIEADVWRGGAEFPATALTPHIGGGGPRLPRAGLPGGRRPARRLAAGEPLLNVINADGY